MALTNKLSAIGDAIREKTGKTDLLTLDQMPTEIASITTGGGGGGEVGPVVLEGNCEYACSGPISSYFIDNFGDKITTENINKATYMFYKCTAERIPFELNFSPYHNVAMNSMFCYAEFLKSLPKFNAVRPGKMDRMFEDCHLLREIPQDFCENWDWSYWDSITSGYDGSLEGMFSQCNSLRSFPMELLKHYNYQMDTYGYHLESLFYYCYSLEEIDGFPLPIRNDTFEWTRNRFYNTFKALSRIRKLTFEFENESTGTPKTVCWKNQTIDLSGDRWGWVGWTQPILDAGLTEATKATDYESYKALKDNPDYWTEDKAYSLYNRAAAYETIRSLPSTHAYNGLNTPNTIIFNGELGSGTDEGAINTLSEDEIGVAVAKGWTVSFK